MVLFFSRVKMTNYKKEIHKHLMGNHIIDGVSIYGVVLFTCADDKL